MKKLTLFTILIFSLISHGAWLWAQDSEKAPEEAPPAKQKLFVGVLKRTYPLSFKKPSEYCLEDGYLYKSADYKIGELFLHSDSPQDLTAFEGKIVMAWGQEEQDLTRIIVKKEKAPEDYGREAGMMQIRSDWVGEETGFNIGHSTHEKLKQVPFFRYTQIQEFQGIEVINEETQLQVKFTNTLEKVLTTVEIIGHYESTSRGKPSPYYDTKTHQNVQPKQLIEEIFKASVTIEERRKDFRLHSVEIHAQGEDLEFAIEVFSH